MNKLGNKSIVLTFSNIATLVITMICSMIIARYRTLEENGTYTQILLVINTVMSFAVLGLPNSITYFIGKSNKKEERDTFTSTYYVSLLTISLLVGIILYCISPVIADFYNNDALISVRYTFLLLPGCLQITSTVSDVLIGYGEVIVLVIYRIIYSVLVLAVNILMVVMGWSFNLYMLVYAALLAGLSVAVVLIIKFRVNVKHFFSFDKKLIGEVLKFCIPLGIATIIGTLSLEFDKLFISTMYSTEVLGMYNYMAKELPIVAVTSSVTSILLPSTARLISNGNKEKAIQLWKNSTVVTFAITAFFVSGVFVYAEQVISILYSDKYLAGATIFRIYTISLLLRFTYFGLFFNCTGKAKKILHYSIIGLVINIVFNYIFYYAIGINGPAMATVLALYVSVGLELKGTCKLLNVKMKDILPWSSYVKLLLVNMVMAICFYNIKKYIPLDTYVGDNLESVLLAFVWAFAYFVVIRKKIIIVWKDFNNTEGV